MNELIKLLFSIFFANRKSNAKEIKAEPSNEEQYKDFNSKIELPPPQQQDIDLTGEYDPSKETHVIFSPLSEDVKFYNLYCSTEQDDFLSNKSEFNIPNISQITASLSGAGQELNILLHFVNSDPNNYHLKLYKVQGYLVLGANLLDNHSNDWYYCTLLELPEGRFNPIILTVKKSPRDIEKQLLEHWADHTRPNDEGNK